MHGSELIVKCRDYFPAYYALDKYPLFKYTDGQNLHLLVIMNDHSISAERMIETASSVGQMLDHQLYIHIVAPHATEYRQHLMDRCPELRNFADFYESNDHSMSSADIDGDDIFDLDLDLDTVLDDPKPIEDSDLLDMKPVESIQAPDSKQIYVHYTFEDINRFTTNATIDYIALRYGRKCRYVFCDIKNSESFVVKLGVHMSSINNANRVMLYTGLSKNITVKMKAAAKAANLILVPVCEQAASSESIERLGNQAYGMYYKYSHSNDHNRNNLQQTTNLHDQLQTAFSSSLYDQLSSACATLHGKYKLACLGIESTSAKAVAKKLEQKLYASEQAINLLCSLEHRRWLMYQVMQGYQCAPVLRDSLVDAVCFNPMGSDKSFRFRLPDTFDVHIKARFNLPDNYRGHTMIVPCDENLGCPLSTWNHEAWDAINSYEEIDKLQGIDELDRVSLRQHLMCREKGNHPMYRNAVKRTFDSISDTARMIASEQWTTYNFADWLESIMRGAAYGNVVLDFNRHEHEMRSFFETNGGLTPYILEQIKHLFLLLSVYRERNSYLDLKKNDLDVVDLTARNACIRGQVKLIKVGGTHTLDQVASALVVEPDMLYMYDVKHTPYVDNFLKSRDIPCDWNYAEADTQAKLEALCNQLLKDQPNSLVMLDVTDATAMQIVIATQVSANNKEIGLVRCDKDNQRIINLLNCPQACVFHGQAHLRVNEVFKLLGAKEDIHKTENVRRRIMANLQQYTPALWQMLITKRDEWQTMFNFLAYSRSYEHGVPRNQLTVYRQEVGRAPTFGYGSGTITYQYQMSTVDYTDKHVKDLLDQLCGIGLLQSYDVDMITYYDQAVIQYTGLQYYMVPMRSTVFIQSVINQYPLTAAVKRSQGTNNYVITIDDPCLVRLVPLDGDVESSDSYQKFTRDKFISVLNKMSNSTDYGMTLVKDVMITNATVSFRFVNEAMPIFFEKLGSPLETFVYRAALSANAFDDVDTSFEFRWEDDAVSNELDVVVTKGLTATIISCKNTAQASREHLYELFAHQNIFSMHALLLYNSSGKKNSSSTNTDDTESTTSMEMLKRRGDAGGIPVLNIYDTPMYRDHALLGQELAKLING